MVKIDILIPTYNRSSYLLQNLFKLRATLEACEKLGVKTRIIISDNASTDKTAEVIRNFIQENQNTEILFLEQKVNIGFSKNLLYLVSQSNADYFITLGDDDYLDNDYILNAIMALMDNKDITCILPSFEGISECGERLGIGRDLGEKTRLYEAGIESAKLNAVRAHQISGIILKRHSIYEVLKTKNLTNLYPQIFMVAFACLNGKCIHLPEWPVLVTQTSNKAWSYDDVGLLNDIFENFRVLSLKDSEQFELEYSIVKNQRWRALRFWKRPFKQLKIIFKISYSKNTSHKGHILLPIILLNYWIKNICSAIKNKIMD